jgi:hypothetical protein
MDECAATQFDIVGVCTQEEDALTVEDHLKEYPQSSQMAQIFLSAKFASSVDASIL